ncbi:hypothetical protein CRG98_012820 [Punica granatum]|uniref:Uncharacterized protein n=1 Tax=Punica granatum TaxID=22663 RepID=A0A2I0KE73_PUNGR|nr:hypothetical protein CRG98_012820 [Punica granatum]
MGSHSRLILEARLVLCVLFPLLVKLWKSWTAMTRLVTAYRWISLGTILQAVIFSYFHTQAMQPVTATIMAILGEFCQLSALKFNPVKIKNFCVGILEAKLREIFKPYITFKMGEQEQYILLASLRLGKVVHCFAFKNGIEGRSYMGSVMLDMYVKFERVNLAHNVFTNMSLRDTVCWNSMITGYSQNRKPEEAINLFPADGS